ncbi:ROK family protein [Terriglobus aquaticus]|uniref:ROK family protein n=1 Tax=Terriglobus aquaticus TaxID=940139 RepID=A0ABW9KMJ4_9BACT|nr:ROK family protein [Terriglobus aquaticus]
MASIRTVGLTLSKRIVAGLVDEAGVAGKLRGYPADEEYDDALVEMPREHLLEAMCEQIIAVVNGAPAEGAVSEGIGLVHDQGSRDNGPASIDAVGVALPGIVRNGVVEDAPNVPQLKGVRIAAELGQMLRDHGVDAPITALNDADAVAAGLAATQGKLQQLIRVWTVGTGIGFGRYPMIDGIGEGGHTVVTLDERESYCGCGGKGHIEGIMGHRAMRLRFLDMEPEDVFAAAENGDKRCLEFKRLWHRALAAGTATSIHMTGAGKFYVTGYNVRFLDLPLLHHYIEQMVRMSPLQGFSVEIRPEDVRTEVVGAAVIARQAALASTESLAEAARA